MAGSNDPGEIFNSLAKLLQGLVEGGGSASPADVWRRATESKAQAKPEPSAEAQRENLMFALATRAVEALEDIALNAAAIRQRLEREHRVPPPTRHAGDRD